MAELREIAIGLATVLMSSKEPEPFPVTLKGQSLADAALLLRATIRECADAGVALCKVEVPPELSRHLRDSHLPDCSYLGVDITARNDNVCELVFYRESP